MKKLWVVAVLVSLSGGVVGGVPVARAEWMQTVDQLPTPPSPEKVVEMMSGKLALTDAQKQQITPIVADRQQRMAALKADTSMRRFQKARQAKSIMSDSDTKIEATLTAEQKKQYEAMKAQMREEMKQRMQQQGGSQ